MSSVKLTEKAKCRSVWYKLRERKDGNDAVRSVVDGFIFKMNVIQEGYMVLFVRFIYLTHGDVLVTCVAVPAPSTTLTAK